MSQVSKWLFPVLIATAGCVASDASTTDQSFGSASDANLLWVGDTHVRVGGAWLPPTIDRSGYAGADWEQAVLDRLQDRVDSLVAGYRKPEGREEKLAQMREVVERARRDLLGE